MKTRRSDLFILSLAALVLAVDVNDFKSRTHTCGAIAMGYRLFIPKAFNPAEKTQRRFPVVLCLHGAGQRGNDNLLQLQLGMMNWADKKVQARHPSFIVVPQCPASMQWVNAPWAPGVYDLAKTPVSAVMTAAMDLLDSLIREFPIDTDRQYITGLSMGGYGTWDAIARYPHRFAAAVPVCGGADTTLAQVLKHIPIWTFHGADDSVVNVRGTRGMVNALKAAGGKALYSEFCCVGHFAWEPAYSDSRLFEWVFRQTRTP